VIFLTISYKIGSYSISLSDLPDIKITREGTDDYKVELNVNAALSDDQIAECILGNTTTISVTCDSGELVFEGDIEDFGTRQGFSKIILTGCTCTVT
jgi:hypothetical protein